MGFDINLVRERWKTKNRPGGPIIMVFLLENLSTLGDNLVKLLIRVFQRDIVILSEFRRKIGGVKVETKKLVENFRIGFDGFSRGFR